MKSKYFRYLLLVIFMTVSIPVLATRRVSANVDETYNFYLPIMRLFYMLRMNYKTVFFLSFFSFSLLYPSYTSAYNEIY